MRSMTALLSTLLLLLMTFSSSSKKESSRLDFIEFRMAERKEKKIFNEPSNGGLEGDRPTKLQRSREFSGWRRFKTVHHGILWVMHMSSSGGQSTEIMMNQYLCSRFSSPASSRTIAKLAKIANSSERVFGTRNRSS